MIIDWQADPRHALLYDVVDPVTYQPIDLPIWFADDAAGIVRVYEVEKRGDDGRVLAFRLNDAGDGVAWREVRMACRIVRNGCDPGGGGNPDD